VESGDILQIFLTRKKEHLLIFLIRILQPADLAITLNMTKNCITLGWAYNQPAGANTKGSSKLSAKYAPILQNHLEILHHKNLVETFII